MTIAANGTHSMTGKAAMTAGTDAEQLRVSAPSKPSRASLRQQGNSYILSQCSGDTISVASTASSMRFHAAKEQTNGAFSVNITTGPASAPIVPHLHKGAHDTWLCLKGSVQVYFGDQSRMLYPGDFASVPPGHVHSFAIRGAAHNEMWGLITPGGWEDFMRKLADPIGDDDGADGQGDADPWLMPQGDQAPFPVQRFIAAIKEGHDVIPQHGHQLADATPFSDNDVVPGPPSTPTTTTDQAPGPAPYFLQADHGPKFLLAGQQLEVLAYPHNNGGLFSIAWLSGSSVLSKHHYLSGGSSSSAAAGAASSSAASTLPLLRFAETHTTLTVVDGSVTLRIQRKQAASTVETELLRHGESAFVSAGDAWRVDFDTQPYARVLVASGRAPATTGASSHKGGIEGLFAKLGKPIAKEESFGGGRAGPRGEAVSREEVASWAESVDAELVVA